MKILVTNDDGVASPGLHALADAMRELGEVWVVAPDRERNAVGHGLTLHKPLRINRLDKRVYAINGTPSDCVNLGVKKLLSVPPALIVSGINQGVNLGDDVTYSGTVSAALEGTILGIPSIAVSQEGGKVFRFHTSAHYALRLAKLVLREGLPEETLLNMNVPNRPRGSIAGVKITSLSRRRFDDPIIEKVDPHGRHYYWIAGTRVSWERREGSDHEAIRRGMVSITPLHLDLTHHNIMDQLRQWEPALHATGGTGSGVAGACPPRPSIPLGTTLSPSKGRTGTDPSPVALSRATGTRRGSVPSKASGKPVMSAKKATAAQRTR